MTKAFITIEVEIDTGTHIDAGLGESSNPAHPTKLAISDNKREAIWDKAFEWLNGKEGFIKIVKVSLLKEKGHI